MPSTNQRIIPPQTGTAFPLKKGERLKVIDLRGEQVSDLFAVDQATRLDALSSGRSIDYAETIRFTKGDKLYASSGSVMFEIVEDTCGTHDFLVTPCSIQMFKMIAKNDAYHPSCEENLINNLGHFGVRAEQITTTFNIFMNVPVASDGRIRVIAPLSQPGDYVVLRAEMDVFVGLTACSDEGSNNGTCKPVAFEILPAL